MPLPSGDRIEHVLLYVLFGNKAQYSYVPKVQYSMTVGFGSTVPNNSTVHYSTYRIVLLLYCSVSKENDSLTRFAIHPRGKEPTIEIT